MQMLLSEARIESGEDSKIEWNFDMQNLVDGI
jgi:hypothetical protein